MALKVDIRGAYRVLMGRPLGKKALGRRESNVKMGLQEVGWRGME